MDNREKDYHYQKHLLDNATILSRFKWSTSNSYKRCMVIVFVCLIFLFLLRFPIYKLISEIPEPPVIDFGHCEANGTLEVSHVHLTPGSSSNTIHITFSANQRTNGFISVQYGTHGDLNFEAFTSYNTISTQANPHVFLATILITHPGEDYSYRVSCGSFHSEVYKFRSWRAGSMWSPQIVLLSGPSAVNKLTTVSQQKTTLAIQLGGAKEMLDSHEISVKKYLSNLPNIILPEQREADLIKEFHSRFTLPEVEWPLTEEIFHTTVGAVQIVGFNAKTFEEDNTGLAMDLIEEKLKECNRKRSRYPWVIALSYKPLFCIADSSKTCVDFMKLLSQYKVDLYIAGQSSVYLRSWPIAKDGTFLSTYHNADGVVMVALADGTASNSQGMDKSAFAKQSTQIDKIKAVLELPSPANLCLHITSGEHDIPIDHFCIEKKDALTALQRRDILSSDTVSYNFTAWLVLVIVLGLAFIILLIGRTYLYKRLCIYMKSDGGIPLYTGKLFSV